MSGVTFLPGVALSSCLAGPMVVTPPMLLICAHDGTISLGGIGLFLAINFYALVVGLFCSMIPNVIGSAMLGALGLRYAWARWWVIWIAAGAGLGWLIQLVAAGNGEGPWNLPYLALVGAACALICRWGTEWTTERLSYKDAL